MSLNHKDIANLVTDFLLSSITSINDDYVDSLNVAIDCIAEAFEIDKDSAPESVLRTFDGNNLLQLVQAGIDSLKMSEGQAIPIHIPAEDAKIKAKAEEFKLQGNKAMASKDFELAIEKYTEAINVLPTNAVYFANRAAAYSSLKQYEQAVDDAQSAIKVDPTYSKGYSRLGFAKYALGGAEEALDAYKKVLDIEGNNATEAMQRDYETAKKKVEQSLNSEEITSSNPTPSASSDGIGGLPDMSSLLGGGLGNLLNNPQVMQAAQKMMQNPSAMQEMMNNPAIRQMAEKFSSGNGAPNFSDMMNDPAIKDMAKSFFGSK